MIYLPRTILHPYMHTAHFPSLHPQCNGFGHMARECPSPYVNLQPGNQSFICYECQGFGHHGRNCPSRRKRLNPVPSLPINSPTMRHAQSAAVSSTRNFFPTHNLQRKLARSLIISNLRTPLSLSNLAIPSILITCHLQSMGTLPDPLGTMGSEIRRI